MISVVKSFLKLQQMDITSRRIYSTIIGKISEQSSHFLRGKPCSGKEPPQFEFYDTRAPIYTSPRFLPPAKVEKCPREGCHHHFSRMLPRRLFSEDAIIGLRSQIGKGCTIKHAMIIEADYYMRQTSRKWPSWKLVAFLSVLVKDAPYRTQLLTRMHELAKTASLQMPLELKTSKIEKTEYTSVQGSRDNTSMPLSLTGLSSRYNGD